MPELPEVEVLARHLRPGLVGQTIHQVHALRSRVLRPSTARDLSDLLTGARFLSLERRGKFLLFQLTACSGPGKSDQIILLGHLGMTGRIYLRSPELPLPRHTAVHLDLGASRMVYEDPRGFGRFTLDLKSLESLGPEPLTDEFTLVRFQADLESSRQPIKVKLLDQSLVAGVGNIYASESLFRAGIRPIRAARDLSHAEAARLHQSIRDTLQEAIDSGSSPERDFATQGGRDSLFYYGSASATQGAGRGGERLWVYDRADKPCFRCNAPIRRIVQSARSSYFCPKCQKR